MPLNWDGGALSRGLVCHRDREFFEAHEHWEDAWNQLVDPERLFVQALIQVTVAMHHFNNANHPGALSLLHRALTKLDRYPEQFGGVEVARLREDVGAWLLALGEGAAFPPAAPGIQRVDPSFEL